MANIFCAGELVAVVKGSGGPNAVRWLPTLTEEVTINHRLVGNIKGWIPEQASLVILDRPSHFAQGNQDYPHRTKERNKEHIWYYVRGISQERKNGRATLYTGWTAVSEFSEGDWQAFVDRPVQYRTGHPDTYGQALATHLKQGARAYVLSPNGVPVYNPLGRPQFDSLTPGSEVLVLEGPRFAGYQLWWRVRPNQGREGWVSEGEWQRHNGREGFEWYLAPLPPKGL